MATAQGTIYCGLCEKNADIIKQKCMECHCLLCEICGDKHRQIHRNVVNINDFNSKINRLSKIKCVDHFKQNCHAYCTECDKIACEACVNSDHDGHQVLNINEAYDRKVEQIQQALAKLESQQTPSESLDKQEFENKIKQLKSLTLMEDMSEFFKHEIFSRILVQTEYTDMIHSDQNNRDPAPYTDLSEARELFNPGENDSYEQIKEVNFRIRRQFETELDCVRHIAICPSGSMWIADHKLDIIHKVKFDGSMLKIKREMKVPYIRGFVVSSSNNVLVADWSPKLKQIVKQIMGGSTIKESVYNVHPLVAVSVHITNDHKIIIGAKSEGPYFQSTGRKVIQILDKHGKFLFEFEKDQNNKTLFTYPKRILSTKQGNIFTIDILSKDYNGRIIVLNKDGRLLNVHEGYTSTEEPCLFKPMYMACTLSDYVVVSDISTGTLHILNSRGNLITYLKTSEIGIRNEIHCLAVNSKSGFIYIGCGAPKDSSEKAKLFEVEILGTLI